MTPVIIDCDPGQLSITAFVSSRPVSVPVGFQYSVPVQGQALPNKIRFKELWPLTIGL